MKLSLEQIKNISTGAVRFEESEKGINLYRFTKEQMELYKNEKENLSDKTFASAGVRLTFKTDSTSLKLDTTIERASSRTYFSIDVFVNGSPIGYIDNFSDLTLPEVYTTEVYPLGEFSKKFDLGAGEKEVCIYLPWSVCPTIKAIEVDDGAFVEPVKRDKKLLAFGDSITQGYDALRPSKRYASMISDFLGAEETNKAIGGEEFYPNLSKLCDDIAPDYILVAYGTNDWSKATEDVFKKNCREFFENLTKNYPSAKIFAVTPIWRRDYLEYREFGLFENAANDIGKIVSDFENITLIRGFNLVPHHSKYFADLRLHPRNEGFEYQAKNLYNKIKNYL